MADIEGSKRVGDVDVADHCDPPARAWLNEAIRLVEADANRSADTHPHVFPLAKLLGGDCGIDLYLKDESVHPTGSLKHRLARSLFLYALCNGWINEGTPVIEASSGSTAVSEAYFARLLDLPFIAVMPRSTSREKIALIEFHGGTCHFVDDSATMYDEARRLAAECDGHYMDQFTYAERATDWRGNNNIAESIFEQMRLERHPVPDWIVVGAGTGGTSATLGRYVRYQRHHSRVLVVDPEGSAFFPGFAGHDPDALGGSSRIEGIGQPRVEPSFQAGVVDGMIRVPDAASIAAARWCTALTGLNVGGSTGTALWGALLQIDVMRRQGREGSVVTLLCDGGERYAHTYYDDRWLAEQGIDIAPYAATLERFAQSGQWQVPPR